MKTPPDTTTENQTEGGADAGQGEGGSAPASAAAAATAEALATREPPTGVKAGVEYLRATFDETAHVTWETNGPRNTHIVKLAGVMVEVAEDKRRLIVVAGMQSGAFKLFNEVSGKTTEALTLSLMDIYGI